MTITESNQPVLKPAVSALPASDSLEADGTSACIHVNRKGQRCTMLAGANTNHPGLCTYHARKAAAADEAVSAELLDSVKNFQSAAEVNRFLGNIVKQMVRKRITRQDAVTLAYLSQLLLNSLSAMNRGHEKPKAVPPRIIWNIPGPAYENAALANLSAQSQADERLKR